MPIISTCLKSIHILEIGNTAIMDVIVELIVELRGNLAYHGCSSCLVNRKKYCCLKSWACRSIVGPNGQSVTALDCVS